MVRESQGTQLDDNDYDDMYLFIYLLFLSACFIFIFILKLFYFLLLPPLFFPDFYLTNIIIYVSWSESMNDSSPKGFNFRNKYSDPWYKLLK